jgi:hypothetical protein
LSTGLAPAVDLSAARDVLRPVLRSARLARAFAAGRLTNAQARRVTERLILDGRRELRGYTRLLAEGRLTLDRWDASMRPAISARQAAAALALLGGGEPGPEARVDIAGQIDRQLSFLDRFRDQLASGAQLLDGTALARSELYADAAWVVGQEVRRGAEVRGGATEEQAVLGAGDSCPGCLTRAALGWQPAGTLAPIGSVDCRSRCHCFLRFR